MGVNKPGRMPKPTALRILHGDHLEKVNHYEPKPEPGIPDCPADASDEVREIWEYTATQLHKMGCVTMADRDMLRAYCEAVVMHRFACDIFASKSKVAGSYGLWEAARLQKMAADAMRSLGAHFGLTPASRSTIKVGDRPNKDMGAERYLSA